MAKVLNELVDFYDSLETAEEIFQTQGERQHQTKKQSVRRTPPIRQVGTEKRVTPGRDTLRRVC